VTMDWKTRPVSLTQLRYEAEAMSFTGPWDWGVYGWLQNIGVVPWSVPSMPKEKVKLTYAPDAIPAGYLASAAYEWDTWGPSQPEDFIFAMEAELNPQKRDFIAQLLTALGRSVQCT